MSAINIDQNNIQSEVMNSDKPVMLDFWAPWCGPCRMVVPIVEEIARERNDIKVGKVNVDEQPGAGEPVWRGEHSYLGRHEERQDRRSGYRCKTQECNSWDAVGRDDDGILRSLPASRYRSGRKEYLATPGAVLLDVRTSEEYRDGHIPGSKNVPLQALDKVASVAENKNMALYVYCHSGARSRQAAGLLRRMGYRNVNNIGGIAAYAGKVER